MEGKQEKKEETLSDEINIQGFFFLGHLCPHRGSDKRKWLVFFQNFSTYDVNTYERSLQVLTADKSDYWSVLSLIFISPPHNVIAFLEDLAIKLLNRQGMSCGALGFFSSIWAGLGAMLLWNSCFQRPPPPTLWRYPLSLVTIYMIIHHEDKSIPGKLISGYNMVWIQDLIERNTPRGVIVIF